MPKHAKRALLLRGKVVHPDGTARARYVLVRNGRIETVSRSRPPRTKDAVFVKTDSEDWVFPGLLDLHTHATYNLLPLWHSPLAPFDNRFQWRGDEGYKRDIKETSKKISSEKKTLAVFAELQAVAGGTTVLQESRDLDREIAPRHRLLLCRDTADPQDLYLEKGGTILSVVDFFKPNGGGKPSPSTWALNKYLAARKKGNLLATLAHVAEGRSGFGTDRGVDPYSRSEFEAFMAHPAFKDAAAVRQSPLALIHGSGIDTRNPEHVRFLRKRNISVIWSPVSNLLLYGDTLDVETLLAEGINVALGSDWSPSGSKHVWDEAKFARLYFDAIGSTVSDEQIFQMVTTNAGRCLGVPHLGRIEPGALGDFFILRSPLESDNPLEVFLSTTDRHVRATIIGGRPIYGARDFLEQFGVSLQDLPRAEGSAVRNKAVHLPTELKVNVDRDIAALEKTMKALDPPVKRSNLLSSSDKIYRRRVQTLAAKTVRLGWNVQQWRKQGPSAQPGHVPVRPNAVRVWRGFRADGMSNGDFYERLGRNFIPMTVQALAWLGMTAYLPTVLPDKKPASVPDEIALVFYESQDAYRRTFQTTIGRAYGLLHEPVFSAGSKSGFPRLLGDVFQAHQPYYLFEQDVDWYHGQCRVLVGTRKSNQTQAAFHERLHRTLKSLQKRPPKGLDGAIVSASEDCLVYWEHWADGARMVDDKIARLAGLVRVILLKQAMPMRVPTELTEKYEGLTVKGGECLNLRFQRRALYPW